MLDILKKIKQYLPSTKDKAQHISRYNIANICRVCNDLTQPFQMSFEKFWFHCPRCDFLQAEVSISLLKKLNKGEGFKAGTGVAGGGYREHWISKLLLEELGCSNILLYGTGNTPTFQKLFDERVDVWGCDISHNLVQYRKAEYGKKFFHTDDFPEVKFDAIIGVEVFEHFLTPLKTIKLFSKYSSENGIVSGTTDFYEGGDISDQIYLKPPLHIAYWSRKSIQTLADTIDKSVSLFKLECPGSVYPDEKFDLLWPRKRVFFLHPEKQKGFFDNLAEKYPILPINKP